MERLQPVIGLLLIGLIAFALSSNRRAIKVRTIAWGLGLQLAFAIFVLKTAVGQRLFKALGQTFEHLLGFAKEGGNFVFGPLSNGGVGVVVGVQIAITIIFVAALFAVLYYLGIMQWVVRAFAVVMNRAMGASGAESLNVAASVFMGQTEAPLTIRPFLSKMTQSELFTVMTSGMAHISGGIMAVYISFGISAEHLLTAVIMTAPGTLMLAKLFVPETEQPETSGMVKLDMKTTDVNIIDAAGRGTVEGLHLALNVLAMLVSFIALVALTNALLGWAGSHTPLPDNLSLQMVFGWIFAPIAWSLGVLWKDAAAVGNLLGTRMVLNEFVAFSDLAKIKDTLDPRSVVVATFALCGFANFASIGIQIGGIGALVPERRHDLARLGLRAMLAGTLANFVSACIAAMLL